MGFPALDSTVTLIGTHHILDRHISGTLRTLIDAAGTIVFEHPLDIGDDETLPRVGDSIREGQVRVIRRILRDLGYPEGIDELLVDEAVSLVQRAAFSALGDLFFTEVWAERYAKSKGKRINFAESVQQRDRAVSDMYVRYLNSLTTREVLLSEIRTSLEDYWKGRIEVGNEVSREGFYRNGVTRRSMILLEHLVFELMRRDNDALAFFGALHCLEMVEWLEGKRDPEDGGFGLCSGIGPSGPRFRAHCQAENLDFPSRPNHTLVGRDRRISDSLRFSPLTISKNILRRITVSRGI